jgi:hypothetical protein
MGAELARFRAKRTCHSVVYAEACSRTLIRGWMTIRMQETRQTEGWTRQRPQQGGRYPFVRRLNGNQLV